MPLDVLTAARLARDGEKAGPIRHMCSGQHTVSLLLSRLRGWDPTDYWKPSHPSQIAYRAVVARAFGTTSTKLRTAIDGCGVETYAFRLHEVARAYAMLADPSAIPSGDPRSAIAEGLVQIRDAMLANPEMVGGRHDRLDTSLMKAAPSRVVSKSGMEALRGLAILRGPRHDTHDDGPSGMAIKIEDGDGYERGTRAAAVEALRQAGVLDGGALRELARYHRPVTPDPHGRAAAEAIVRVRARTCGRADRLTESGPPAGPAAASDQRDHDPRRRSVSNPRGTAGRLARSGQGCLPTAGQGQPSRRGRPVGAAAVSGDPGGLGADQRGLGRLDSARAERRVRPGGPPGRQGGPRRDHEPGPGRDRRRAHRPDRTPGGDRPATPPPARARRARARRARARRGQAAATPPPAPPPRARHQPGPADRPDLPDLVPKRRPAARRRSDRRRMTVRMPASSSQTGAGRAGTARPAAPTGRSTQRNTPIHANTGPSTRRARAAGRPGEAHPTEPQPLILPTEPAPAGPGEPAHSASGWSGGHAGCRARSARRQPLARQHPSSGRRRSQTRGTIPDPARAIESVGRSVLDPAHGRSA